MKFKVILFAVLFLAALSLPSLASAMAVTINIPANYSEVKAGTSVYFQTEVKWPENIDRKDLRIEYSIKDKDGNEVAYLKVLKAIETQASFMDSIPIPESVAPGMYKITATISDYGDLNQEVAVSFKVAKAGNNIQAFLFIIIGLLSAMMFLLIIRMFFFQKKRGKISKPFYPTKQMAAD